MSDNTREFITQCYRRILHREPDIPDLEFYFKKIENKEISEEQLPLIFRESDEFKQIQRKREEFDINYFEKKIYSQNGEDGIIEFIFSKIGTTNKFYVEFGVWDGLECNSRLLKEHGWNGLWMDKKYQSDIIKKENVTAENVEKLFKKYNVSQSFDLLSIDIDFNDYWVWKSITNYYPNVVVIEYNASYPPNETRVVKYDPNWEWDETDYFGASLLAMKKLGASKGYTLIGCESNGVNAFFCKNKLVENIFPKKSIEELFRPPRYGQIIDGKHIGHPPSDRKLMTI